MASEKIADMTVEQLKALIAEEVQQQLLEIKTSLAPEISESVILSLGADVLPIRTQAEQQEINQALIKWLREWREEGDEQEQRETFAFLQQALDEDRLSNRPLFSQK
jgi:hypothetical protein